MYNQRTYSLLTRRGYIPNQDFNIRKLPNGDFEVEWFSADPQPTQEKLELAAYQDNKISEVFQEGLRRTKEVYNTLSGFDDIQIIIDILDANKIAPQTYRGNIKAVYDLYTAVMTAQDEIRLLSTEQEIDDYEPEWPT